MTKKPQKIGVMGGTFDPIHYGHLVTAEAARAEYNLDEVVFVPTGNPPHKAGRHITNAEIRLQMCILATVTNQGFAVSRIEIDRPGNSYAYDTVRLLHEQYGKGCQIYFITGADAILEIASWHKSQELLDYCTFIAATRPGFHLSEANQLPDDYLGRILFMEIPALAISSTDIRQRVHDNRPIHYLLPEAVAHYIKKEKLYLPTEEG